MIVRYVTVAKCANEAHWVESSLLERIHPVNFYKMEIFCCATKDCRNHVEKYCCCCPCMYRGWCFMDESIDVLKFRVGIEGPTATISQEVAKIVACLSCERAQW